MDADGHRRAVVKRFGFECLITSWDSWSFQRSEYALSVWENGVYLCATGTRCGYKIGNFSVVCFPLAIARE